MSDRKNRDVGRKRTYQGCNYCGCWHCMCGAEKKRIILERSKRNDLIHAGDMMAGDGGYEESTFEKYEEFNRQRNYKIPGTE